MIYSIKDVNGEELDKSRYKIDFEKKTFFSSEYDLVIDFSGLNGWSFSTGSDCIFKTGNHCKFKTYGYCKFETGNNCKFETLHCCIFKTGNNCKFDTFANCKFKTGNNCELKCYSKKYKLNKGFCCLDGKYKLYTNIDENWALLNMKHDNKFIRDVCKFILKGC